MQTAQRMRAPGIWLPDFCSNHLNHGELWAEQVGDWLEQQRGAEPVDQG